MFRGELFNSFEKSPDNDASRILLLQEQSLYILGSRIEFGIPNQSVKRLSKLTAAEGKFMDNLENAVDAVLTGQPQPDFENGKRAESRSRIISIDGINGSGKTTLIRNMLLRDNTLVLKTVEEDSPSLEFIRNKFKPGADEKATVILNALSDLRFVNCIEQCVHACVHCLENAGSRPSYIPFSDFRYEIDILRKLKEVSDLNFSYKMFDVTTHQDGDTMMYRGYETASKLSAPKYSSYDVLKTFRDSHLFDSGIQGRDRFQLFTTGWFDYGSSTLVSDGAKQIVEDAEQIFGIDPQTGEKGRMVFSFGTYPKYFHMGEIQEAWWKNRLVDMFDTIRPLAESGFLQISIKYVNRDIVGEGYIDIFSEEYQINLLADLLKRAGYNDVESLIRNDTIMRVRPAYKAGRGRQLDLPLLEPEEYMRIYYPQEYGHVRQDTRFENTLGVNGILKSRKIRTEQYNGSNEEEYKSEELYKFWLPSDGK